MGILDAIPDLILGGAIISLKRLKISFTGLIYWAYISFQIKFYGAISRGYLSLYFIISKNIWGRRWIIYHCILPLSSLNTGGCGGRAPHIS